MRIFYIIIAVLVSGLLYSQTAENNILVMRVEPRPLAMGQAFTSVANDLYCINYNPAGLVFINNKQGSLLYQMGNEDMIHGQINYVDPLKKQNGLGASINIFHLGTMDHYSLNSETENIDLGNSYIFGLSYAHLIFTDALAAGTQLKYCMNKLGPYSASTGAVDIGLLYYGVSPFVNKKSDFSFGLALQNLGPGLKYVEREEALPLQIKLGISYVYFFSMNQIPCRLLLANDLVKQQDEIMQVYQGLEMCFKELVFVRCGFQWRNGLTFNSSNIFSTGAGISYKNYQIDYSLQMIQNELSVIQHSFGLIFTF